MKKLLILLIITFVSCKNDKSSDHGKSDKNLVAAFQGMQVTGVTVSNTGRIFANFPRWRKDVPLSVVEINPKDGSFVAYPNKEVNSWKLNYPLDKDHFIAVQSVVCHDNKLYVLDTRNPLFNGVLDAPRIFVIDLKANELSDVYKLNNKSFNTNSYINDLRIDPSSNRIYMTDSGSAGLVVYDIATRQSRRILDNHYSTLAETNELNVNGTIWKNIVHSDGIAFNTKSKKLYFHSLTGYSLYAIDTNLFDNDDSEINSSVELIAKTSAPDGMIFDAKGNLYYADLEAGKINYLTPKGKTKTLLEGPNVNWADTFSIYDDYLYYTNSRIHEASDDVSELSFTIRKVKLP
ncbi:MAG: hypothetical protein BM564_00570 [Bacteroidetes bacterium MedPE-SWsnd-G2]|nr:MAG: hypothetical protein BM564_00570 [Bacteroidetes bacterium MedPE-SWsnd-G2]